MTAALFAAAVSLLRAPGEGVQPQVVAADGIVHLIYLAGDPARADALYARSSDEGRTWSEPVRVNSPGSAIATGTIRGAHLAVGRNGRVHVAWNGSVRPPAMFYTRSDGKGKFEPERNLIRKTVALDGGGSVAADANGRVYVVWHAALEGAPKGESQRRVWMARSNDEGATFAPEEAIDEPALGACACCGLRVLAQGESVYVLYRSAKEEVHRDVSLLASKDGGSSFHGKLVDPWQIPGCPMSSMTLLATPRDLLAAWETAGQVYWGNKIAAPGDGKGRKHPVLARNGRGETILAWTEGTGWKKGGNLAWQVYDREGRPTAEKGLTPGIPVWSYAAVWARADGGFNIIY